jgi:hypothetical protein
MSKGSTRGTVAYLTTAHSKPKSVDTVEEFLAAIYDWEQHHRPADSGFLSELWYRGTKKKYPDERPGVYRDDFTQRAKKLWHGGNIEKKRLHLECHMLGQFRRRAVRCPLVWLMRPECDEVGKWSFYGSKFESRC